MNLSGTRVLVLVANLFEDTELLYPVLRLKEEEAKVVVASPDGEPVTGKKGHGPVPVDESVAFICHAGWVPVSAGIIDGRRATSYVAVKADMVNAGCVWDDAEVVVDGNLISSRHPGDLGPWLKAIIGALKR
jgi:protease I